MLHTNIEIKAKSNYQDKIRDTLISNKAEFKGIDHQIDTYFKTTNGRFKLRESSLSGPYLIFYIRENLSGPKSSVYQKLAVEDTIGLKDLLKKMQGVDTIVEKKREIYQAG